MSVGMCVVVGDHTSRHFDNTFFVNASLCKREGAGGIPLSTYGQYWVGITCSIDCNL